jgi:hypoxanthine-DNA glycosylase
MKTKFGLKKEQIDDIKFIFSQHPNIEKAILFGSRAKGNYRPGSDIDFALTGKNLTLRELFSVGNELESLPLPISFDLILYQGVKDIHVIEHINRVGVLFYKKEGLIEYGLPPLGNPKSRILLLGTFPSDLSLIRHQYYANSRNYFWKIVYDVYNLPFSSRYEDRVNLLLKNQIILWDVIKSCERKGSLDNKIKHETINDFHEFVEKFPKIEFIIFNGDGPESYYRKNKISLKGIKQTSLPSSSSANTHMTLSEKIIKWTILKAIKNS